MEMDPITTELRQDVANLRADLGTLLATVKEMGLEQSREAYGQARAQVQTAQANLERYIETRPLTSILFALGTGFAIGSLIGHRR